ncbi:MAG: NADH-quinone oxidoreductase subunit H [Actinomycetota bacterium]|nr:NADH-quinone oxidoreductase subunit H [Actinomycetota bacterium]
MIFNNFQFLIIVLLSPLVQGIIKKLKALGQGRVGAGIFQPYLDLIRLFRKGMVISKTASRVFHAAPFVVFLSTLAACALVPVISANAEVFGLGDVIALFYTLALGRFFLVLAGLDAGTAFGGEGSSREAMVAILVEPMIMLAVFTAAVAGHSTSAAQLASNPHIYSSPAYVLAFCAFYVALIAETGRIPVDNPDTHLELTMIHEGMVLEYSGGYLALLEWAHWMKQMLLFTLAADLFFPFGIGMDPVRAFVLYSVKMAVLGAALALTETSRAKLRIFQLPSLLGGAFVLALLSIISVIALQR